jgi:hypothetical protein
LAVVVLKKRLTFTVHPALTNSWFGDRDTGETAIASGDEDEGETMFTSDVDIDAEGNDDGSDMAHRIRWFERVAIRF